MSRDNSSWTRKVLAPLRSGFIDHPKSVGETYFQHQRVAAGFAVTLTIAAVAAMVHSVVPCLFQKTASNMIAQLNNQLHSRSPSKE